MKGFKGSRIQGAKGCKMWIAAGSRSNGFFIYHSQYTFILPLISAFGSFPRILEPSAP